MEDLKSEKINSYYPLTIKEKELFMYFRRKLDSFLAAWHADPDRLPLIVRGARQVGKTETIRHFAASAYDHIVEINFVEEP